MASEESHALLHANGGQPGGLYSVEGQLGADQYEKLRSWIEKQITRGNRFKPFVLDRGAKWTPTTMNGVDSEHINTRKHQIEEICRAFRVMPIMIGQSDKAATYASAEQMFLAHVVHTLSPWYERIEQSIACNLLSQSDNQLGYYAKFIPNALMRGAAKDRSEFYYKMWSMGALSPNDIRALEDTNPYEGGENYYTPANFAPVGETTTEGSDEPVVQTEN
jgi:HK97 family phage portal protein